VYLNNAEAEYDLIAAGSTTGVMSYDFGMAWDYKIYGCYPLLAKFTGKAKYYEDMERNLDFWTDGYNGKKVTYTPGGLAWLVQWGSLRYACNTAFMAVIYGELPNANATKKTKYKNFAVRQVNYALGDNPDKRSYMCGFGNNPPKNPHHRGAHGTWNDNLTGPPETNRHILYGALVGGPGNSDNYKDDRGDYISNEVATDYNAGITGVLAKILSEGTNITLPAIPKETVGEEYVATIKSNSSGSDYFEPAINIFNRTAWPARMPKKLSFRYFIDIAEGVAKGFKASDYTLKLNYAPDATLLPGLKLWTGTIYYAEIEYNNALFYPGGQSPSRRECQIRVTGPAGAWNSSNDFSNTGVTNESTNTLYIPIYENGVKIYGNEPPRPLSNTDYDLAIQNSIKVLPNPTSGNIKIDLPESVDIKNINISDISGRLLTSQNVLSAKTISMDISNLPLGLYIMTFKSEDKVWTKKIVKE
jgi:endoglucanase